MNEISEKELVRSSRNLPPSHIIHMGENAQKAFELNRKEIELGIFIENIQIPQSRSSFFFRMLPDGILYVGKIKSGEKIFEQFSVS